MTFGSVINVKKSRRIASRVRVPRFQVIANRDAKNCAVRMMKTNKRGPSRVEFSLEQVLSLPARAIRHHHRMLANSWISFLGDPLTHYILETGFGEDDLSITLFPFSC